MYTMEYCSATKRNEFESVVMSVMNLKFVIQSEVNRKRKTNIVYKHIYMESRKMVLTNLF